MTSCVSVKKEKEVVSIPGICDVIPAIFFFLFFLDFLDGMPHEKRVKDDDGSRQNS